MALALAATGLSTSAKAATPIASVVTIEDTKANRFNAVLLWTSLPTVMPARTPRHDRLRRLLGDPFVAPWQPEGSCRCAGAPHCLV